LIRETTTPPDAQQSTPQKVDAQAARRCDTAAGGLLALLTLLRLWYDAGHDLIQDEAYYWQWSRHLDWGYYDNTPLTALVIRLGTGVFGTDELGVRAGATFCSLIACVFLYLLARRLLGPVVALAAVALACVVPLFAAGSVLMTQDPVQLAFWAATLYVVQRALTDRPGWPWWIGAGVLAGLAAQAKLNALLLLPSVFLYILLSPAARGRWLRRPQPYAAGLVALLVFTPFLWWNHTHQNAFWIHIHAMSSRGTGHDGPKWVLRFLGDQALLLSPFLFLTYLYALYDGARRGAKQHDEAWLFLWCPSLVAFAATVATALKSKVEGNWAVAAYVTGLILVAAVLVRLWERRGAVGKAWGGLCVGVALLLAGAALFPNALYAVGITFPRAADDRTNELYGWREMGARVASEQAAMRTTGGGTPFVFGINYRMPSEAAFYLPGRPQTYALFLNYKASEYMFWEDPARLKGRDAVFLNDTDNQDHFDDLRAVFARVEPQPPLRVYRNPPYADPIRTVQVVRCYGFKGYDVRRWQDGW